MRVPIFHTLTLVSAPSALCYSEQGGDSRRSDLWGFGGFAPKRSNFLVYLGQSSYTLAIMAAKETPIFTRTFDLLTWLLPVTDHFPKAHRHTVTQRLLGAAFDLRERLEEANNRQGAARQERLERADEALSKLRLYLRLTTQWGWLSPGQYKHVSVMVAEVGRLLGGWQKTVTGKQ